MRVVTALVLVGMLTWSGAAGVHVVVKGDTLERLARRFGVTVAEIAEANGLRNPDHIRIGQRLTIPERQPPPPPVASATVHVVAPGDTLHSIARRYGVPVDVLAAANGIVDGQVYRSARLRLAALRGPDGRILAGPPVARPAGVHVVRGGDTLERIARTHRTTVAALVEANGLRDPDRIRIGQRLALGRATDGGFRCPIERPVGFVNDWGFPRGGGRVHEGIDLFADRGTPVVAPVGGVVRQAVGQRGGQQFRLDGDDGFVYIGTHLHTFGAAGRVPAGAVLGTVGTSGDAVGTPAHLHLEIHPGGIGPVNPYPTIVASCRAA